MIYWFFAFALGSAAGPERALCDRGAPEPVGFHSRGFEYVAEVFPPTSRHNAGARPVIYAYKVAYPGQEWRIDAQRIWKAELPHSQMPQSALVSMEGHVIALDDYHESGGEHALAIYDIDGHFVKSLSLQQLLDTADVAKVQVSDCGRMWREGSKFYFTTGKDPKLYVVLPWQRIVEVSLGTGGVRRGVLADFPGLRDITARAFPNELAEVWSLSLRFSSLTDIVIAR